jgi:hypothetical protein
VLLQQREQFREFALGPESSANDMPCKVPFHQIIPLRTPSQLAGNVIPRR